MALHSHAPASFTMNEDRHMVQVPSNGDLSSGDISQGQTKTGTDGYFSPLPYMSNYISVTAPSSMSVLKHRIRIENEYLLKKYYSSKKSITHAMYRHGSVASSSETSNVPNERSNSYVWMNKFLDDSKYMVNLSESGMNLGIQPNGEEEEEVERRQSLRSHAASSYFKYIQRLLAVDSREHEVLKRHNLWIPMIRKGWRNPMSKEQNDEDEDTFYDGKVCPLFIDGNDYISKDYDLYRGCTSIPSVFSEYKLPAFVYHCAVELDGQVYIFGGLMACHKHDDEAPSLRDFHVDGVKNLPPPLLSSVVNNPSMINNSRLYVMSASSNTLRRPELSGQIPPPLLCMKGSKLTERHIFFYGGFEIRTETNLDDSDNFYLRERAYMNNTGYILDTMTFNFTKVELTAVPYKYVSYPTFAARFGHLQQSISNTNGNLNNGINNNSYINHQTAYDFDGSGGSPRSPNESISSEVLSSPAFSVGSPPTRPNNAPHNSGVYSILIFGGYRQTGDDDYEAMNDLWRIDVQVLARGKRGHYKFGNMATATMIPRSHPHDPWPSPRAFVADCITDIPSNATKPDLLERLQKHFFIDKDTFVTQEKSRPFLKGLPHSRTEPDRSKIRSRTKENNGSGSSHSANSTSAISPSANDVPNSFLKQRVASPSSTSTTPTSQPKFRIRPKVEHKILIVHGGSNKTSVCQDMWWYDIESETWSNITTYGQTAYSKMTPITLGLVDHSLVCVGGMAVFVGGLLQEDIDSLYYGVNYHDMPLPPQLAIGSDFIRIFDLSSQCLLGHTVTGDETSAYLMEDPHARAGMLFSSGFTVIQFNGDILLFGGTVSRRFHEAGIYLRGAVLKCLLPSMKLAT